MSAPLMCMAHHCWREATRDLESWPLCGHCKAKSNEVERRWGARVHDEGTHMRKEVLGGHDS